MHVASCDTGFPARGCWASSITVSALRVRLHTKLQSHKALRKHDNIDLRTTYCLFTLRTDCTLHIRCDEDNSDGPNDGKTCCEANAIAALHSLGQPEVIRCEHDHLGFDTRFQPGFPTMVHTLGSLWNLG